MATNKGTMMKLMYEDEYVIFNLGDHKFFVDSTEHFTDIFNVGSRTFFHYSSQEIVFGNVRIRLENFHTKKII